jgi:hypothetical protein
MLINNHNGYSKENYMEGLPIVPNPAEHLITPDHVRLVIEKPSVFSDVVLSIAGGLKEGDSQELQREKLERMTLVRNALIGLRNSQRSFMEEAGDDV